MKNSTALIILSILVLSVLGFKLYIANSEENFTLESYQYLRHSENIMQEFIPNFDDELSYQGREYWNFPLYYYLMALGLEKIITNVLVALASFLVYFVARNITKSHLLALLAAIFSLFIPATAIISNNALSPLALALPLYVLVILSYTNLKTWGIWPLVTSFVLLMLSAGLVIPVMFGFLTFLLMQKLQNIRPLRRDVELVLFFTFITFWFIVVTFNKAFSQGLRILWQNTPSQLVSDLYVTLSATEIFAMIGIIPLLFGIIGINRILSTKNRAALLIATMGVIFTLLLLFRLIPFESGALLLGFTASMLSPFGMVSIKKFFEASKVSILWKGAFVVLVLIFSTTAVFPFIQANISQEIPSDQDFIAAEELAKIPEQITILSSPVEANFLMYQTGKKTYYDSFYLFSDAQKRHETAITVYTRDSLVNAVRVMEEERIDYIYFSEHTKQFYGVETLKIAQRSSCLKPIFEGDTVIYKNECQIN